MKRFQAFRLDPLNQCLWRGEQRMPITPKAFDVLRYLVEHPGRLVTHEEILEALWPKVWVNQEVVKKYILGIRKILGDRHDDPIFIATIPRRGYQFVAEVVEESPGTSSVLVPDASRTMAGREAALAGLDTALDQALRGERQVVFVTGEAGIGKTTLVDAFHRRATRHANLRVARGQCVEGFGGKEAYYPVLEALGQLTRPADRGPVVQVLAARAPTWLVQLPSLFSAEQGAALQRDILGATRQRMVREICEALEELTAQHPLVLLFEDLHWVDPSTLDFISAFARRRDPAKLLLLCTYRPVDVAHSGHPLKGLKQDLQVHRLCDEIALEPLEESEIAQYLATELAGGTLPSGLVELIRRRSGGNALFMVAIVQEMVKQGLLVQDASGWRLSRPLEEIDPGVPETLQRMLAIQLDQLSLPQQRVLKSASVVGERFSIWSITAALDAAPKDIEDLCEDLVEREQFIKGRGIEELPDGSVSAHYEFRHSLYRDVIYRSLSDVIRSRLHLGLGERLETLCAPGRQQQALAAELALHFERGHAYERAIRYLVLTAENAARRFAWRDAIHVLQQALELVPKVGPDLEAELALPILEFIGDAHYVLGSMVDSANAYAEGAARAAAAGLGAARVSALACLTRPFGLTNPDQGIAAMDQAAQACVSLDDPMLLARTQMLAAAVRLLYDTWRKEDAQACVAAHKMLRGLGAPSAPTYHELMYAYVRALQGHHREALDIFEAFIPKTDQPAGLMAHHLALGGKTVVLLRLGRFGEVLRIVRAGREAAEKNGNDPWLFNFRETWLRTLALDFAGARRLCESITRPDAAYPTGQPETIARIAAGYSALGQGDHRQAIEYFKQVGDPRVTPKFFLHWIWRIWARLGVSDACLASGDLANAREEAGIALHAALSTADPILQALAWETKARIAMAEMEWDEARDHIEQAVLVVKGFDIPVAAWRVHATAWALYLRLKDHSSAQTHRASAHRHVLTIANSFESEEPLRRTFLGAAPVRRILGER